MKCFSVLGARALIVFAFVGSFAIAAMPDPSGSAPRQTGTPKNGQSTTAGVQTGHHPSHMHAALHELKHARTDLKEAKHDYGGHREKALEAVDHAIHQLEKAIAYHHHHHQQQQQK